jgi:hypothetical protein
MFNAESDIKKWAPVLEHADAAPITDSYRKAVTAKLLENTEVALKQERAQYGSLNENNQTTTSVAGFDPILISLVRRAMPNLIAFDVAGVQPMSGPTGLIFAMKSRYNGDNESPSSSKISIYDQEAFGAGEGPLDEPDTAFSGTGTHPNGEGMATTAGESLGTAGNLFGDMGFTIEKTIVEAKTRGLKAEYTMELAQG